MAKAKKQAQAANLSATYYDEVCVASGRKKGKPWASKVFIEYDAGHEHPWFVGEINDHWITETVRKKTTDRRIYTPIGASAPTLKEAMKKAAALQENNLLSSHTVRRIHNLARRKGAKEFLFGLGE